MLERLIRWRLSRQKKVLDKHVGRRGFLQITSARIIQNGRAVVISYQAGNQYRLPAELLRKIYLGCEDEHPFYAEKQRRNHEPEDPRIVDTELFDNYPCVVRVFFDDGQALDMAWDVVLRFFEPDYQHFGGFTDRAKALATKWSEEEGPFRIDD